MYAVNIFVAFAAGVVFINQPFSSSTIKVTTNKQKTKKKEENKKLKSQSSCCFIFRFMKSPSQKKKQKNNKIQLRIWLKRMFKALFPLNLAFLLQTRHKIRIQRDYMDCM